ncbi:hypothetical protein GCK72_016213 [Caenorhabditis remanei]|uniref:C-type lectin domain-containing protein n=1 Tax=Caenorhabditis remanei TaxID=31234 RepID=A0A6A5GYZ7_CAERE|nr:hypothetical protein GCK72_016213 [Caenorhabditis remanei]KAF1759746.1 hypothetical protein GCK72_016213 [Caenorhabditis remanei]
MLIVTLIFSAFLIYSVEGQCSSTEDSYIGDLCYTIYNQQLSFQNAQSYCYGLNKNLGVIHTTLQSNFLASLVRTKTGSNEALFWIGLSRPSLNSRFQWDDGTTMSWSNFDSNFPKDNLNVAESVLNGKWRTMNGQEALFFVCSYDPRKVTPGTAGPTTTGYYTDGSTTSTDWPASTQTQSSSSGSTSDYPTDSSKS